MSRLSLYFHTLRYLKPIQIWGRLIFRLRRPAPDHRPAPSLRVCSGNWHRPAAKRVSMLGPARFRFLNEERDVSGHGAWNSEETPGLWLYNLHYFDDLNATDAPTRAPWHRQLIERWIAENPPGAGAGWEPYPLSLRIVNWIKWTLLGNPFSDSATHSLAVQARYLRGRLEFHLLGNHLFANAKALVFAGLFFDGEEAYGWLGEGLRILRSQLQEQALPDGGHFERSPMYHALALEDVLDLINLSGRYSRQVAAEVVASWHDAAARMLFWLRSMCHPDGEIALFNDAAFGIAASLGELDAYAARLAVVGAPVGTPVAHLADSGYVRAEIGPAVAFLDVAPIGPDYLPGHAHADTLSFELSLFGQRWLVDSGCSHYGADRERLRQRGTAAHNTVVVNGQDSSEVWSSFRVARRARVLDVSVAVGDGNLSVSAAHDGYRRLGGKVIHRRQWRLGAGHLEIADVLDGQFASADAFLHFHPEVSVEQAGTAGITLRRGERVVRLACEGGDASVERSTWHPEFGLELPNRRIRLKFQRAQLRTRLEW